MRRTGACAILWACGLAAPACGSSDATSGSSSSSEGSTSTGHASTGLSASTLGSTEGSGDTVAVADTSSTSDASTGLEGCPPEALLPGQYNDLEVEHGGVTRTYNLYVPVGLDVTVPAPLVLNFHGLTSNASQQQFFSNMDPTADTYGLIVAYPEGLDSSWNAGSCCGTSATNDVDDVGFALAVVADVESRMCVDPKRVYSTGMSNGAFMSHRLGCEHAEVFAAIAPVAGVLGIPFDDCQPSRPLPVLHFHGTLDPLVPYTGNGLFPAVLDTIALWSDRDGCVGDPVETFAENEVHCEASEAPDGVRTELCTVDGGGHCWPGTALCPYGVSTTTINASDRMAEFFAEYSLP